MLPYLRAAGELKTKPSQQSVGLLRNIGIIPDILVCRTEVEISESEIQKLALFCNVPVEHVIEEKDVAHSIYEVPLELEKQNFDKKVLNLLHLPVGKLDMDDWRKLVDVVLAPKNNCTIAVVGKYTGCPDAYKSIVESIHHAGIANDCRVKVELVEAELLEKAPDMLNDADCILIPGGFGNRGIPGKLQAIQYAREKKIPILGICLGLQCMVIEYARNVLNLKDADSVEMNPDTPHPVIHMMHDQRTISAKGGTMRLGSYPCRLQKDSHSHQLYGKSDILERHRHRYEFNNLYREDFAASDLKIVGTSPDDLLVEMVELQNHPFFIGCQFHPEFQSQIAEAHPLFKGLIAAALKQKERNA